MIWEETWSCFSFHCTSHYNTWSIYDFLQVIFNLSMHNKHKVNILCVSKLILSSFLIRKGFLPESLHIKQIVVDEWVKYRTFIRGVWNLFIFYFDPLILFYNPFWILPENLSALYKTLLADIKSPVFTNEKKPRHLNITQLMKSSYIYYIWNIVLLALWRGKIYWVR